MKRNVTIVLDESTARWVRVAAAERDTSVSRFLAAVLHRERERQEGYESAMLAAPGRRPRRLGLPGERLPSRVERHERSGAEDSR